MKDHVQIIGDRLVIDNGEEYTLQELRYLRWELINWRRIAQATQRDLAKTGMQGAVVFEHEEWRQIRAVLRLLDAKLPGLGLVEAASAAARPAGVRR